MSGDTSLESPTRVPSVCYSPSHINQGASPSSLSFFFFFLPTTTTTFLGVLFLLQGMHAEIQSGKKKQKKKKKTPLPPSVPPPAQIKLPTRVSTHRLHSVIIQETSRHCKHAIFASARRPRPLEAVQLIWKKKPRLRLKQDAVVLNKQRNLCCFTALNAIIPAQLQGILKQSSQTFFPSPPRACPQSSSTNEKCFELNKNEKKKTDSK